VYALWYNGQFGEDNLYLLRPFSPTDRSPAVTIRYRYKLETLSSPEKGQPLTPALSAQDRDDLLKSLELMQSNLLKDKKVTRKTGPSALSHPVRHQMKRITTTAASPLTTSMKRWPISPSGSLANALLAPSSAIMAPTATASMRRL
jgi:hypothetical protein